MKNNQRGQAILIIIFVFALIITLGLVSFSSSVNNLLDTIVFKDGNRALYLTQSSLENGFLRLLRNPGYSGESLQLENASCIIIVNPSPLNIRAECDSGRTIRKLEAPITYSAGQMQVGQITEME